MRSIIPALLAGNQQQENIQKAQKIRLELETNPKYTIDGLKKRLFKRLTDYLDSRADISTASYTECEFKKLLSCNQEKIPKDIIDAKIPIPTNHCYISGFANVLLQRDNIPSIDNLIEQKTVEYLGKPRSHTPSFTERFTFGPNYEFKIRFTERDVRETDLSLQTFFDSREKTLTIKRIKLILSIIETLNLLPQKATAQKNDNHTNNNANQEQEMQNILNNLVESFKENQKLNEAHHGHHTHRTGIRFFDGSLFQSQAERTILDCIDMVEKTQTERERKIAEINRLNGQITNKLSEETKTPVAGRVIS